MSGRAEGASDLLLRAEGKTALVTGGARGIGRKGAETFLESGAFVIIADKDIRSAQSAMEELAVFGPEVSALACDVTDPESVRAMVDEVQKQRGHIDILFNNAGICVNEAAEEMSFDSWKRVIEVNLTGVFLVAQAVGRVMISQRKGVIINTASMSAHVVNQPQPQCAYNASKAGVVQLTKSLAVEWARYGVRVNCISPGYIATEMTLKAPAEWKDSWDSRGVYERMGRPEELQSTLRYLASDASSFTTGADIVVDGAYTAI